MHELEITYLNLKDQIDKKQQSFLSVWHNDQVFTELTFCICTPQSKAKAGFKASERLKDVQLIEYNRYLIEDILGSSGVRFKKNKTKYLLEAYEKYSKNIKNVIYEKVIELGEPGTRNWIAENIKGLGMKEASHFLRNIGYGKNVCILDRHILRELERHGVISTPEKFDKTAYLDIEEKMIAFAHELNIPVFALDFVFWADTHNGELFK